MLNIPPGYIIILSGDDLMKKILSAALCALLIGALLTSCGLTPREDVTEPGDEPSAASASDAPVKSFESVTYEISDGQAVITGCVEGTTDKLSIPESIEGCPVTRIDDYAFLDEITLTGVAIPDSVVKIEEGAFYGCTGMRSIDIPDTVTSIGHNALRNTAYYNFKSSWEGDVLYAGSHLISAKRDIEGSCKIREGTRCIADNAFYDTEDGGCEKLTEVIIPEGVTSIGNSAFEYCGGLTEITVPYGVVSIGSCAFRECTALDSISLPPTLKSTGENAFVYTALYNDAANWDEGVLYIDSHLIKAEDTLKGLYKIKQGTLSVADSAFSYCTALEGVVFPLSVTHTGRGVFDGCPALMDIYLEGPRALWEQENQGLIPEAPGRVEIHFGYAEEETASPADALPEGINEEAAPEGGSLSQLATVTG